MNKLYLKDTAETSLFSLAVTTSLKVTLGHPLAGINHLDDVDKLLERHDRGRNTGDDPRPEAIDLVRTSQLKSAGTPRAGEQAAGLGVRGVSGLGGGWLSIGDRLQKGGGEGGRREGQQVEADEEKLVQAAAEKENDLK